MFILTCGAVVIAYGVINRSPLIAQFTFWAYLYWLVGLLIISGIYAWSILAYILYVIEGFAD